MVVELNGKKINVNDDEVKAFVENWGCSEDEAINMWLEDNDYLENEEVEQLTKKVAESGIMRTVHEARDTKKTKERKPKTVKTSDEKKTLFNEIYTNLRSIYGENAQIGTENKLIFVEINGKKFKIDLIEQRKPKK